MNLLHTFIKIFIVGIVASGIAYFLGVYEFVATGIIGILSISTTTKDSLDLGIKRLLNGICAILVSWLLFMLLGYEIYTLVLFLIIFVPASIMTKTQIAIVPGLVLTNHIFGFKEFTWFLLLQQLGVIFIATIIAWTVNFLYPKYWLKGLKNNLINLDLLLKEQLDSLSLVLKTPNSNQNYFNYSDDLNKKISQNIQEVELNNKNLILQNDHRYLAYVYMRRNQFAYVNKMFESASKIKSIHKNNFIVADFINQLTDAIGNENKASSMLKVLNEITSAFQVDPLPVSREEFETRAMLYQMIHDLEGFLNAKVLFHQRYPDFQI